ncbi:hypothetical protein L227DRAFT_607512 [Lentinus tigrinus ALCF2SS1-6]|uniref:Uncharacterized protein n=1 Tax=Lentinus tigrinus ALCF2SS1-6 TaxID=1328759 RepID=A0A5C2SMA9_9APHY|nr:hypothetical protein L227DRAFT_607512 [Lentinus tigrinus ALCF2SS1-6]
MADQLPSSAHHLIPQSNPSLMEDAMASLRFDSSVEFAVLHPASGQIPQPQPQPPAPIPSRTQQVTRHHSNANNAAVNLDPTPGDPETVFIRAPFTDFPGSADRKVGLTYNDMAANPNWFLDVNDFVGPNAVVYPTQLEPPRGWLPKKEVMEGAENGKDHRLRCTLCRRQYAGVNAKSMWRRHVYEKHKIAMANRRDNNDRPGGRGRANKENKAGPSAPAKPAEKELPSRSAGKCLRRVISLEVQASSSDVNEAEPLPLTPKGDPLTEDAANGQSSGEEEQSFVEHPSFSSTPPQTPGICDSLAPAFGLAGPPPESPYNPLMTPAFRHSPALRVKQIWRYSPKASDEMRNYTLAMLARGESSPNVRGLDVSPLVLVPASERQKRSIFSPPRKSSSTLSVSPRRLFAEPGEEDSIQSRLDQPGWDAPSSLFLMQSPSRLVDLEESVFDLYTQESQFAISTPLRPSRIEDTKADYFALAANQDASFSPPPTIADTPHTKMFINGLMSPLKGPDSSPIPSTSEGPRTSKRSGSASLSPSPKMASIPFTPLLPAFSDKAFSPMRSGSGRSLDEARMDVDESQSPALGSKLLPSWQDLFNPGSSSRSQLDSESSVSASTSLSGAFGSISSLSVAGGRRPTVTPSQSTSRNRGRSVSNGGTSSSSSGGQKSSIGLMDAVLDKKSRRRKHSHSEHRGDGDVGVTAMGSPFKMGRKTSRSDFLYSLDGDCEMQDSQPKKRRKTISGRD